MIVVKIILGLAIMIVVILIGLRLLSKRADSYAINLARTYCKKNGLEFDKVEIYPASYGLRFKFNGKSYLTGFEVWKDNGLVWKKGSPVEIVSKKNANG